MATLLLPLDDEIRSALRALDVSLCMQLISGGHDMSHVEFMIVMAGNTAEKETGLVSRLKQVSLRDHDYTAVQPRQHEEEEEEEVMEGTDAILSMVSNNILLSVYCVGCTGSYDAMQRRAFELSPIFLCCINKRHIAALIIIYISITRGFLL